MRVLAALVIVSAFAVIIQPLSSAMVLDSGGVLSAAFDDAAGNLDSVSGPDPPRNLTVIPGIDFVDIHWEPPLVDGGSPILGYEVRRGLREDTEGGYSITFVLLASVSASARYFRDVDVRFGETWYYGVCAFNAVNSSQLLEDAWARVGGSVPGAPMSLTVEAGESQVNLTWVLPPDQGGTEVFTYGIYRGTADGSESRVATHRYPLSDHTFPGQGVCFTDRNLTNGQRYYYRVSAINALGEGLKSNSVTAIPDFAPVEVSAFGFLVLDDTINATVNWHHPREKHDQIINYRVYRQENLGAPLSLVSTVDSNTTSFYEIADRHFHAMYRVAAVYADGHEVFSDLAHLSGTYWEGGGSGVDPFLIAVLIVPPVSVLLLFLFIYSHRRQRNR